MGTARALPSGSSLLSGQASNRTALSFGSSVKRGAHPLSISSFYYIPGAGAGVIAERLHGAYRPVGQSVAVGTAATGLEPNHCAVVTVNRQ